MTLNEFGAITAKKAYTYRHNPMHAQSFLLLKRDDSTGNYTPAGEYTVLDKEESSDISEKKVMNIITMLNGQNDFIDLGAETGTQMLYHPIPRQNEKDKTTIIFYSWTGNGVSKENAVMTIEEDFDRDR